MAAAQQAADVIVAPDVEDQVFGPVIGAFPRNHPAVGLVDAVAAHAEVPDRLAQVCRQIFLPGLAVADLVALREAVAIGIDAALSAGVHERSPSPVGRTVEMVACRPCRRSADSCRECSPFRVEDAPSSAPQEAVDHFRGTALALRYSK